MAHKKFFLNDEAIKAVRDNVDLYAEVSKALDVAPGYLPALIRNGDPRLTQMNVLEVIAEFTKVPMHELVEEVSLAK